MSFLKVAALLVVLSMAYAYPRAYPVAFALAEPPHPVIDAYGAPAPYHPAPEPYHHHHLGRVKIQAYRGPNKDKVAGYEYFAPWGYYATQPADLKVKGYHH